MQDFYTVAPHKTPHCCFSWGTPWHFHVLLYMLNGTESCVRFKVLTDNWHGFYLKQRRGKHDRKGGNQLILTLFLNLNTHEHTKRDKEHRYISTLNCIYSGQYTFFFFYPCPLTSLVFLMICCRRMRKFSGSLFTISSRLQRFIDCPAEHISTEKQQMWICGIICLFYRNYK